MPEKNREAFLRQYLPEDFAEHFDLLTDFRCSGYRILGDLVCDWVILPVTSFDMYYGGSYFSKRILSTIPEEILERQNHTGTCRYRITDAFRL